MQFAGNHLDNKQTVANRPCGGLGQLHAGLVEILHQALPGGRGLVVILVNCTGYRRGTPIPASGGALGGNRLVGPLPGLVELGRTKRVAGSGGLGSGSGRGQGAGGLRNNTKGTGEQGQNKVDKKSCTELFIFQKHSKPQDNLCICESEFTITGRYILLAQPENVKPTIIKTRLAGSERAPEN